MEQEQNQINLSAKDEWLREWGFHQQRIRESEEIIGDAELGEKLRDPKYLPTRSEVLKYFQTPEDASEEQRRGYFHRHVAAGTGSFFDRPDIREILTSEYINAIANYLQGRFVIHSKKPAVEVGAGSGRLAHFINQRLNEVAVIATDSNGSDIANSFSVEKINFKAALQKYKPAIVLCSWMPQGKDWSDELRNTASVQEYILIGDPNVTGDSLETWGYNEAAGEFEQYKKEQFERIELPEIAEYQITPNDSDPYNTHFRPTSSTTISFRRKV